MYIVFGNEIIDSSEIKDIIEGNSNFNVEKDLTKGSKREDTLAYQISISIDTLNEVIRENYELDSLDEEELFDEYMTLADELAMELATIQQMAKKIATNIYFGRINSFKFIKNGV